MEKIYEVLHEEQRLPMSYEEFLTYVDEDIHAEWVNGEAIIFMPSGTRHQEVFRLLFLLLGNFVQHFRLGAILSAPYEMRATPTGNAREPDIFFVAKENLNRLTDKRLQGPADLVVEIVSPESVTRDRREKFQEYQAAGIREYWVIDPRPGHEQADFWVLGLDRRFHPGTVDENGIYRSTVIANFWLDTQWLWAEEQPDPISTFFRITESQ